MNIVPEDEGGEARVITRQPGVPPDGGGSTAATLRLGATTLGYAFGTSLEESIRGIAGLGYGLWSWRRYRHT